MEQEPTNNHKCLCEKKIFNCEINIPINCSEWVECLNTNDGVNHHSDCCTIICCPIKFPINLLFFGPCTLYNIFRNKCNNTNNKNYLC